jgi:hypothetical protein
MVMHLARRFLDHSGEPMLGQLIKGIQVLHVVLFAFGVIGFFIFWARTRFWLPQYAHILAAVALVIGIWCVSNVPGDAPISKTSPAVKFLFALLLPTIVYFFLVSQGGQRAAFRRRFGRHTSCPHCGLPLPALQTRNTGHDTMTTHAQGQCPNCGPCLT